jgi:uncharacterized protein (DUF1501 family)
MKKPLHVSRRRFLKGVGASVGALACSQVWPRIARAAGDDPVLVVVYLRGGADGLNLLAPVGDPAYAALRPNIGLPASGVIDLDGFFGLHPALGSLWPLHQAGEICWLHAVGSRHPTRSHLDAQDDMEHAAPGDPAIRDGWLNRYLHVLGGRESWRGITLGSAEVLALKGTSATLAFTSIDDFVLSDANGRQAAISSMYDRAAASPLQSASRAAFDALAIVAGADHANPGLYPPGAFGEALADAAALVRSDLGVRVIAIDLGGWDHHAGEDEALAPVAGQLGSGIASFRADLGSDWARTCVVVMTEFGRTAAENGSRGTDHGHGGSMFCAGGAVAGGRVLLAGDSWPGLAPHQLHEGRDLAVTTDFRDVFAELLHRHMGAPFGSLAPVFPGHALSLASLPGIFG